MGGKSNAAYYRQYYQTNKEHMRKYYREYARKWRQKNKVKEQVRRAKIRNARREILANLKAGPCLDCKKRFPPECMDFDHVEGIKKFTIAKEGMYVSLQKLLAEIEKCELVCANCHRIRTKLRYQDNADNS